MKECFKTCNVICFEDFKWVVYRHMSFHFEIWKDLNVKKRRRSIIRFSNFSTYHIIHYEKDNQPFLKFLIFKFLIISYTC